MTLPFGRFANRPAPFPVDDPVFHEGVPDHLEPVLRQWIYNALLGGGAELMSLRLEIPLHYDYPTSDAAALCLAQAQRHDLLRIVNAIWPAAGRGRHHCRRTSRAGTATRLALDDCGKTYRRYSPPQRLPGRSMAMVPA